MLFVAEGGHFFRIYLCKNRDFFCEFLTFQKIWAKFSKATKYSPDTGRKSALSSFILELSYMPTPSEDERRKKNKCSNFVNGDNQNFHENLFYNKLFFSFFFFYRSCFKYPFTPQKLFFTILRHSK